jgi:hypothetical protein
MRVPCALLFVLALLTSGCSALTESRANDRLDAIKAESKRIAEQAANEKLDRIKGEERPDAEWTGVYYEGDGLGANISLGVSHKQGAAYVSRGCLGTYGAGVGTVREENDAIVIDFDPHFGPKREANWKLYPVRWGQRHYLIAEAEMERFSAAVRESYEPRNGMWGTFLLRSGDDRLPASEEPHLPTAFQSLLKPASPN